MLCAMVIKSMKENSEMICLTEKEKSYMKIQISMTDNLKMEKRMEKDNLLIFLQVNEIP